MEELYFEKYFVNNTISVDWDYVMTIPEFQKLRGVAQPHKWHMEGDAFVHTQRCVAQAIEIFSSSMQYFTWDMNHKRIVVIATLFHDIGKPDTTQFKNNEWHSYGHDAVGEKITRRLLWDEDVVARERVCSLVRWHMEAYYLISKGNPIQNIVDMSFKTILEDLMLVHEADIKGSQTEDCNNTINPLQDIIVISEIANKLGCYNSPMEMKELKLFDKDIRDRASRAFFYHNESPYGTHLMDYKEKCPQVIVLIGISGSGKDSYIEDRLFDTVLCRDDIRTEIGLCGEGEKTVGTPEQEKQVTTLFEARLLNAVQNNEDHIVINNMNLKKKYRDEYKRVLKNHKVFWRYVYIQSPSFEENIKRRKGQISEDVLKGMQNSLEWPLPQEYDTFEVIRQEFEDDVVIENITKI